MRVGDIPTAGEGDEEVVLELLQVPDVQGVEEGWEDGEREAAEEAGGDDRRHQWKQRQGALKKSKANPSQYNFPLDPQIALL
jgi:hypothetical protein